MGSHENNHTPVPGKFVTSQAMKGLIFGSIFLGLILTAITIQSDNTAHKSLFWEGYLIATFFFLSVSLGGVFFTAIQHVTNAGWSVPVRRVAEGLSSFLPYAAVLTLILAAFGAHTLYEWTHVDVVAADPILSHKASYLNEKFFWVRLVAFFALWIVFARSLVNTSIKQDASGDHALTAKNIKTSVLFLLVFALSYSLFAVDTLMSLDPHWFSTIFGVYCFAGLFTSAIAVIILFTVSFMKKGLLNHIVDENHLHDLGKLMFAFTVFYAYIAFSQFMLIWYANLPEETIFYAKRGTGIWLTISMSLLVFKFAAPFFLLLPRAWKRDASHLCRVAYLVLFMQFIDLYWLVGPNFHVEGRWPWYAFGPFLVVLGVFVKVVTKFYEKHPIIPIKDPRLHESLHHHI